ncbi:hypothetical protein PMI08_01558 [Brevibacillus sp. CF112]|uniref:hypothetical protein n=1 Tax=Brevibacillus TaxID=55080 RepID=UPI000271CC23|nr:hypothetical protein [Brevibacillus sp. CF112]EJL45673.1 hypothetical protein PMI08_01558 [Brevibacillus sp. CF112]
MKNVIVKEKVLQKLGGVTKWEVYVVVNGVEDYFGTAHDHGELLVLKTAALAAIRDK